MLTEVGVFPVACVVVVAHVITVVGTGCSVCYIVAVVSEANTLSLCFG